MKRPVFIAAVIVLSGMICGINESDYMIKAAALLTALIMSVYLMSEVSREDASLLLSLSLCRRLTAVMCAALFCLGLARGACVSHYYNTGERSRFFAEYEPGNPGVFDYSLYLKSRGVCSTEQYEQMTQDTAQNGGTARQSRETRHSAGNAADPAYDRENDAGNADGTYGDERAPAVLIADSIRSYCGSILDRSLSEHDAGICKAVLLGDRADIDSEIRDLYQDAGIAHLLAVSGLHVSMIGAGLYGIFRRRLKLKASVSTAAVSAALCIYMLVTGAGASVVRAVIMLILSLAAVVYGRNYCMISAMSLSAAVLAVLHPYIIFTSGFQLSFGAVAAISLVGQNVIHRAELLLENAYHDDADVSGFTVNISHKNMNVSQDNANVPSAHADLLCGSALSAGRSNAASKIRLKKHISRGSRLPKAASAFIISASIQLVTLPIIAYHYYCFPVYGILLNFIVIPLMAVVLGSAVAVLAAGTFTELLLGAIPSAPPAAVSMLRLINAAGAAPGHYVLRLYEFLCRLSLRLPFASVCIGRPGPVQILIYYLLLFAAIHILLSIRRTGKLRIYLSFAALIPAAVLSSAVLRHYDIRDFEAVVLDVGQGDCIYVRNRGEHMLIDGGSSSRKDIGNRVIESFLLSEGVDRLDAVVVSHADNDHVNGIEYLLGNESRISIDRLVLPLSAESDEAYDGLRAMCRSAAYDTVEETGVRASDSRRTGIVYPAAGQTIAADRGFDLSCIYPGTAGDDMNRQSQVLLLRKGAFSMLLTGDTTAEDERVFASDEYMKRTGVFEDQQEQRRLTVLKAAHHGSSTSNSAELFAYFRPQSVIVSCGRDNRYGHPHEEVTERISEYGAHMLRTDEDGAVTIYVSGDKVKFSCFRSDYKRRTAEPDSAKGSD